MGHHLFNCGRLLEKNPDFRLQIHDPLLRGGKLPAISITQTLRESVIDALIAALSVQARLRDPKIRREITNSAPFVN